MSSLDNWDGKVQLNITKNGNNSPSQRAIDPNYDTTNDLVAALNVAQEANSSALVGRDATRPPPTGPRAERSVPKNTDEYSPLSPQNVPTAPRAHSYSQHQYSPFQASQSPQYQPQNSYFDFSNSQSSPFYTQPSTYPPSPPLLTGDTPAENHETAEELAAKAAKRREIAQNMSSFVKQQKAILPPSPPRINPSKAAPSSLPQRKSKPYSTSLTPIPTIPPYTKKDKDPLFSEDELAFGALTTLAKTSPPLATPAFLPHARPHPTPKPKSSPVKSSGPALKTIKKPTIVRSPSPVPSSDSDSALMAVRNLNSRVSSPEKKNTLKGKSTQSKGKKRERATIISSSSEDESATVRAMLDTDNDDEDEPTIATALSRKPATMKKYSTKASAKGKGKSVRMDVDDSDDDEPIVLEGPHPFVQQLPPQNPTTRTQPKPKPQIKRKSVLDCVLVPPFPTVIPASSSSSPSFSSSMRPVQLTKRDYHPAVSEKEHEQINKALRARDDAMAQGVSADIIRNFMALAYLGFQNGEGCDECKNEKDLGLALGLDREKERKRKRKGDRDAGGDSDIVFLGHSQPSTKVIEAERERGEGRRKKPRVHQSPNYRRDTETSEGGLVKAFNQAQVNNNQIIWNGSVREMDLEGGGERDEPVVTRARATSAAKSSSRGRSSAREMSPETYTSSGRRLVHSRSPEKFKWVKGEEHLGERKGDSTYTVRGAKKQDKGKKGTVGRKGGKNSAAVATTSSISAPSSRGRQRAIDGTAPMKRGRKPGSTKLKRAAIAASEEILVYQALGELLETEHAPIYWDRERVPMTQELVVQLWGKEWPWLEEYHQAHQPAFSLPDEDLVHVPKQEEGDDEVAFFMILNEPEDEGRPIYASGCVEGDEREMVEGVEGLKCMDFVIGRTCGDVGEREIIELDSTPPLPFPSKNHRRIDNATTDFESDRAYIDTSINFGTFEESAPSSSASMLGYPEEVHELSTKAQGKQRQRDPEFDISEYIQMPVGDDDNSALSSSGGEPHGFADFSVRLWNHDLGGPATSSSSTTSWPLRGSSGLVATASTDDELILGAYVKGMEQQMTIDPAAITPPYYDDSEEVDEETIDSDRMEVMATPASKIGRGKWKKQQNGKGKEQQKKKPKPKDRDRTLVFVPHRSDPRMDNDPDGRPRRDLKPSERVRLATKQQEEKREKERERSEHTDEEDGSRVKDREKTTRKVGPPRGQAKPKAASSSSSSKPQRVGPPQPKSKRHRIPVGDWETDETIEPYYCHQCRTRSQRVFMNCTKCHVVFCVKCITVRYAHVSFDRDVPWFCARCAQFCNCTACTQRRGEKYVSGDLRFLEQPAGEHFVPSEALINASRPWGKVFDLDGNPMGMGYVPDNGDETYITMHPYSSPSEDDDEEDEAEDEAEDEDNHDTFGPEGGFREISPLTSIESLSPNLPHATLHNDEAGFDHSLVAATARAPIPLPIPSGSNSVARVGKSGRNNKEVSRPHPSSYTPSSRVQNINNNRHRTFIGRYQPSWGQRYFRDRKTGKMNIRNPTIRLAEEPVKKSKGLWYVGKKPSKEAIKRWAEVQRRCGLVADEQGFGFGDEEPQSPESLEDLGYKDFPAPMFYSSVPSRSRDNGWKFESGTSVQDAEFPMNRPMELSILLENATGL